MSFFDGGHYGRRFVVTEEKIVIHVDFFAFRADGLKEKNKACMIETGALGGLLF